MAVPQHKRMITTATGTRRGGNLKNLPGNDINSATNAQARKQRLVSAVSNEHNSRFSNI